MREQIYTKLYADDQTELLNPLSIDWDNFTWSSGYTEHTMSELEIYRPYLISYHYYNTIDYEDIILLLNSIGDVFSMRPGAIIRIPKDVSDIDDFILEYYQKGD